MNLFALTNMAEARIIRFPLSQALQDEIKDLFERQLATFLNGIDTVVAFDGRYRPEEGELLSIDKFEDIDGLGDAVTNPLRIELYDPKVHSLDSVKALFTAQENNGQRKILIQLFENRRLIAAKGLALFYSGNTFQKMSDAGLTMDTKLLAVLQDGALKFQSFHYLRRVFDLDEYFKEATADEVQTFAAHEKLAVADAAAFVANASAPIRKKIALIRQSGILEKFTTEQIVAAAQTFGVVINTSDDGRIAVPNNSTELRRLLRFLDEDYYQSPLSQTRYISNSKRVAD